MSFLGPTVNNRDKVLSALSSSKLCDDCLSVTSGVTPRQTVNAISRELSAEELVFRHYGKCDHCHKAKIVNRQSETVLTKRETAASTQIPSAKSESTKAWYWEGNVQDRVVTYLTLNGYTIRSVADTASREAGKDIVAVAPDGSELLVSVKGYPEKSSNVQARHWFSGAVFDLVLYRGESPNVRLALALPGGFATYTNLLPRIAWLKQSMQFQVFWVYENGKVFVE